MDRQERICRDVAERLMRQPKDLEELLTISDEMGITMHGQANRRDLSDPDDWFFLRIEVAHACRSSDDTSRRLKDAMADRAGDLMPHVGPRRYGYSDDGLTIIEEEATTVRRIFDRYLEGAGASRIATELNKDAVPTRSGKPWQAGSVLGVLDCHHVAGILVFRGAPVGRGVWPAIIGEGLWDEVRERRTFRAAARAASAGPVYPYLLRGVVTCGRCGVRMTGSAASGKPGYACNRRARNDGAMCARRMNARDLEKFVVDAAKDLLTKLTVSDTAATVTLSAEDRAAIDTERAELVELKDMWDRKEIKTREYREMRRTVEERIGRLEQKTVIRPTAEVLEGLTGPDAPANWDQLAKKGEYDRLNAVIRFLYGAVIIGESTSARGTVDFGRIGIEENPL